AGTTDPLKSQPELSRDVLVEKRNRLTGSDVIPRGTSLGLPVGPRPRRRPKRDKKRRKKKQKCREKERDLRLVSQTGASEEPTPTE
ncbi:hypothetical protein AVEN_181032-1, partial [Araneus ventricosus]